MGRIRTAFVSGLVANNPLAVGGTSLSATALASLPVIAAPDFEVIVLDPAGSAGNPEIVYVTAHTAAATTATILRAQEGTSARAHAAGIPWVVGPTLLDYGNAVPEILQPDFPITQTAASHQSGWTANTAYLTPMKPLQYNVTVTRLFNSIGTQSGNIDVGIYEWDGTTMTKIVSLGSTACPAAGQGVYNITDTPLYRGTRYFFAVALSSNTASVTAIGAASLAVWTYTGYSKATSFPLPSTLATLTNNSGTIPFVLGEVSGGIPGA